MPDHQEPSIISALRQLAAALYRETGEAADVTMTLHPAHYRELQREAWEMVLAQHSGLFGPEGRINGTVGIVIREGEPETKEQPCPRTPH